LRKIPWSEICPAKVQRAIGENEAFIKLIGEQGDPLGRKHWAISSIAVFTPTGSLTKEDLPSLCLKAWQILRFNYPSITARVVDDKTIEYMVPDTAALKQWAAETFHVVKDKTVDDLIPDLKPGPYATLTYLPKSNEIPSHMAHWRTDGVGVLLLINTFFNLIAGLRSPRP
jgi:hypothetical protein